MLTLGLARVAQSSSGTVESGCFFEGDLFAGLNKFKKIAVRLFSIELKRFVANGVTAAAAIAVAVVVDDLFEWALVDNGLVAFEANTFLTLEGLDRERTELDSVDCLPGGGCAFEDSDAVKAGSFKSFFNILFITGCEKYKPHIV